ncbi:MAG: hypothetical protein AAGJ81_12275 [Verrucomicrobiota bacterium]
MSVFKKNRKTYGEGLLQKDEDSSGFALIISLSLMAVIVLAVVLLASQLRVAIASNSDEKWLVLSRENAKLSLAAAIGGLQEVAGEDRRATARAEILGAGNFAADRGLWTGVWDASSPGADPEWLVSGTSPQPQGAFSNGSVEILPPTDPGSLGTQAPLEEIRSGGSILGRWAWWAGGEASGASLSGGRRGTSVYGTDNSEFEDVRSRIEFAAPFGVSLTSLFDGVDVDADDDDLARRLNRLIDVDEELSFISDSSGNEFADNGSLSNVRRDVSGVSFGILENTLDGGLKKNLYDTAYRDNFLANGDLTSFLGPKNGFLSVGSGIPDRRSYAGKPFFSPRPILSEAVLYIGLFHTWSDAKIRVRYHVEGEFWNPYSFPLRFAPDSGNLTRGVILKFTGLPEVDIVAENLNVDPGWQVPDLNDNFDDLLTFNTNERGPLTSWMEISPTPTSLGQPELLPGEVYRVMEPNPETQARGIAKDFDDVRWSESQESRPNDDADIRITATHPDGGVTVTVDPFGTGNGEVAVFENIPFDDFEVVKKFRTGTNPFSRDTSGSYEQSDYIFAYHFRIYSDESDVLSMRDLQSAVDLRDPDFRGIETYKDLEGSTRTKSDLIAPLSPDPSFIVTDDSNLFSLLDQITDGTLATLGNSFERSHEFGYRNMVLYDVPDGDAVSIGQLASLPIYRRAPRSIGNSWGGVLNEAFDRYFLSPKLVDSSGGAVIANPWLRSIDSNVSVTPDEDDAVNEMVDGAFNINSTSFEAWRAVLAAPAETPQGLDENRRGRQDVYRDGVFFRLPSYQAELGDFYLTEDEIQKPERLFQQGIRVLADDQIDDLAASIVESIEDRAEPFFSVADFVNSGIISDAIADVGSRSGSTADVVNDPILMMEKSNVYLDQSDVISRVAPFATVRSDTFRVRAYGQSIDPRSGDVVSFSLCEAILQRVPDKLDGSDVADPTNSLLDSRSFRLLKFDWIDEG